MPMIRFRLFKPERIVKWISHGGTCRLAVLLAVSWIGNAIGVKGQDRQKADQLSGKKDELFVIPEPGNFRGGS